MVPFIANIVALVAGIAGSCLLSIHAMYHGQRRISVGFIVALFLIHLLVTYIRHRTAIRRCLPQRGRYGSLVLNWFGLFVTVNVTIIAYLGLAWKARTAEALCTFIATTEPQARKAAYAAYEATHAQNTFVLAIALPLALVILVAYGLFLFEVHRCVLLSRSLPRA